MHLTQQRGDRVPLVPRFKRAALVVVGAFFSLPLGGMVKTCQQKWTLELRSPRGIAAVAYAKNMPQACFFDAAGCPRRGRMRGRISKFNRLIRKFFPVNDNSLSSSKLAWYVSMAFPSSVTASPRYLPPGEGLERAIVDPTESARSAARKVEDDPKRRHSYQASNREPP